MKLTKLRAAEKLTSSRALSLTLARIGKFEPLGGN
jgi:hypothetical protein